MNKTIRYVFLILSIYGVFSACSIEREENIDLNKNILDAPLLDVIWCGDSKENDEDILVLTQKGTLYRSSDKGINFQRKTEELHKQAIQAAGDMDIQVGYVNKMQRSPVDPNLIVFLGSENLHWISEDCGGNFRGLTQMKNFQDFQYHPTQRNWILASAWTTCRDNQKGQPCSTNKQLYLTKDAAKTWIKLRSYVGQYSWGLKSNATQPQFPIERIVWSEQIMSKGNQKLSGWSMNMHMFVSDDFLVNRMMIVNQGNRFLLTQQFLYVAQVLNANDQIVKLMVSVANTENFDFRYAQIEDELKLHSFTILDTQQGETVININHHKPTSPMGDIFISDATGTRFARALQDNVRDSQGQCDFVRINGLKGIYVANVYAGSTARRFEEMIANEEGDQEIEVQDNRSKKKKNNSQLSSYEMMKQFLQSLQKYRKSVITFDQGAMWKPIAPPSQDSRGNKIKCDISANCSLHLNSHSSYSYGPIYSADNSVGIIIATGNVGQYLENSAQQIQTYLSRDAGLTWSQIREGSHIYEIGDHGGIIVMASDQKATKSVIYSWDQGLSWRQLQIYSDPVQIRNIITEPDNKSQRFIVYGQIQVQVSSGTVKQGIVVSIDFEKVHVRQCQGADQPGTAQSDYEKWTPSGSITPQCLLGGKFTFVRRKRDACCYNGEDWDRLIQASICECTQENWSCDLGFERKTEEGACQPEEGFQVSYDPPEVCDGYYYVTQGYRKVSGDHCEGGVDHSYIRLPCPMFSFFSLNSLFNIFLLLVALAGLYFLFQNQDYIIFYLSQIADSGSQQFGGQTGQQEQDLHSYMDFGNVQVDRSDGPQFDSSLIEPSHSGQELNSQNNSNTSPSQSSESPANVQPPAASQASSIDIFDPRS